jgi:serine/threonine protein kinase
MLTGKHPFQSKDKRNTYKLIQHANYRWPPTPEISEVARNFVDLALQKDPNARPSAQIMLSHPFILRRVTAVLPVVVSPANPALPEPSAPPTEEAKAPPTETSAEEKVNVPSFAVRMWWDYSHRYGLAYLLHNHVCGACFNDASRILLTPDEGLAQYWENAQASHPEIVSMVSIDESPIRKKLLLIKHFAAQLKHRVGEMKSPPLHINLPTDVIPHVKYWARGKEGVLFRMANRDIQANFRDHTKLVIESRTRMLFFDTGRSIQMLALSDLSDRERYREVRRRFALLKELARRLV